MQPGLESGLFALSGAGIGGVIAAWITYRLNERTRRLDLYKVLYPKKIDIAQKVLRDGWNMFMITLASVRPTNVSDELKKSAASQQADFLSFVFAEGWLMDMPTIQAVLDYHHAVTGINTDSEKEAYSEATKSYTKMVLKLQHDLHLHVVNDLFRDYPKIFDYISAMATISAQEASQAPEAKVLDKPL